MTIEIESHKAALQAQQAEFDTALDALKAQLAEKEQALADKDEAHTKALADEIETNLSEIAKLNEEHATALEALRVQLLEKHAAEMENAEKAVLGYQARLHEAQDGLKELRSERDAIAAELVALKDGQTDLAKRALERNRKVQDALAVAALAVAATEQDINEAMRPAEEKAQADREKEVQDLRARLAKLENPNG